MHLFERIFPRSDVRAGFREIDNLEQSLPREIRLHLAFDAIKGDLRQRIREKPDKLSWALNHGQKIEHIVLILARDVALEHLKETLKSMSGRGFISLFDFLTARFEQEGIETPEQAEEAKTDLREMIEERLGS